MNLSYLQLLAEVQSSRVGEEMAQLPPEIELQSLFFAGHLGRCFVTNDGREVQIVQFGEWNHGPGPDFLRCAIEVDGIPKTGPIELDTRPADWEAHGHASNPAFDEVILHLTIQPAARQHFTRNSRNEEILQAAVPLDVLYAALPAPPAQAPVTLGRCATPLCEMPVTRVEGILQQAARHRAAKKAAHFQRVADTHGFGQALWQTLAMALGYHQNRLAMTLLAQRATLSQLRNLSPLERTAMLFGLGGFLSPDLPENAPSDARQWLAELWSSWWKHRPHLEPRVLPWQLAGLRPANHPQRRIAAMAAALAHWPTLEKLARSSLVDFQSLLTSLSDPFWDYHYTLTSAQVSRRMALVGKQRASDFLINTLHPLALQEQPEQYWPIYAKVPGGTPSDRVLRAAHRLFGNRADQSTFLKKAWQQQALLQIYQDFCLVDHSDCRRCQFPEQLRDW